MSRSHLVEGKSDRRQEEYLKWRMQDDSEAVADVGGINSEGVGDGTEISVH